MLFDTFADTVWRPSCVKLRECTKVGYESALACHILPQWSGRDMDAISVADIESWLDSFDRPGAARPRPIHPTGLRKAIRSSNRWSERHRDATLDPTAFAERHLRRRAKGDGVASGLHIDAMKTHARIGHRGAVHLERGLQSSRKREKLGRLPLLRGIPVRVAPDGMKRDDQHPADKRGAIIHVPVDV